MVLGMTVHGMPLCTVFIGDVLDSDFFWGSDSDRVATANSSVAALMMTFDVFFRVFIDVVDIVDAIVVHVDCSCYIRESFGCGCCGSFLERRVPCPRLPLCETGHVATTSNGAYFNPYVSAALFAVVYIVDIFVLAVYHSPWRRLVTDTERHGQNLGRRCLWHWLRTSMAVDAENPSDRKHS